jgi:two-component system cell cycle sensor histidine kinase/response regulator CckA
MGKANKTREELLLEVANLQRQLAAAQAALETPHGVSRRQDQQVEPAGSQSMSAHPRRQITRPDTPLKILLIEDNPGDARLIREMLAEAGAQDITLEWVPRLSQGLEHLSQDHIDLVLLDLTLPDSRGLETFCQAYAQAPEIPFVLVSSLDDETLAITAVQNGAQDYLIKGETNSHKLLRTIRYATERKKLEEDLRRAYDELEVRVEERTAELVAANQQLQKEIYKRRQIEAEQQGLLTDVQTFSEELQLTNEELRVHGEELRVQNDTLQGQAEALENLTGELESRRNLLRAVLDQMPAGVMIAEPSGRIILSNRRAEEIWQPAAPDYLADLKHFNSIPRFYPDGRPCPPGNNPLVRALSLGQTVVDEEYLLHQEDDNQLRTVHLSVNAIPVRDQQGAIIAAVATYNDITVRKQAETALRQSEERYRSLVELSPDAIVVHARGEIVFVNMAAVKLFGAMIRGDLLGQAIIDRIHPDYHDAVQERIRMVQSGGAVYPLEEKILRLNGEVVEVEAVGGPIMYQGRPAIQVIFRDITLRKQAEAALRAANEQLRAMIEASPLAIFLLNPQGVIQGANPAAERVFGWRPDELLGERLPMVPEDKWREAQALFQRVYQGDQLTGVELRRRRKDGSAVDVTISLAPMYDENGRVSGIITLVDDITARKQAEAALAQSRAEFEAIFNSFSDAIIFADVNRRIVLVNPAAKALFGYDSQELIGKSTEILYANRADFEAVREKYYPTGQSEKPALMEVTYRRKNGTLFTAESLASQVRDSQGNILGGVGIHRDITARRVAEAALHESQRQTAMLADFLDSSSQPFVVGFLDGRLGMFNAAYHRLLGYSHKELSRLNWEKDLTPPEWLELQTARLAELQRTGRPERYEKEYLRKDGSRVPVEMFVHLRRDEQGKPSLFYAFVTDITARKEAEAALQESEARFRTIFEGAPIGIALTGIDGRILTINAALEKSLGYGETELAGKTFSAITHAADVQKCKELLEELLAGRREQYRLEKRYICKDGRVIWVDLAVSLLRDAAGVPKFSVGMVQDITARKEAEESLKESEERYRSLFEKNHAVMLLINPETAAIVDANPAACSFYGFSREELTAKKITDINSLSPERIFGEMQKAKNGRERPFHFRHRLAGGEIRDVEVFSAPIRINGQNLLYSIIHDITARKEAEAALERERQRLYALLNELPGFIFLHDENFAVRFANRRCKEIFGDPGNQFCYSAFHQRQTPCEGCPAAAVFANQTSEEWEQTTSDGRTFQVYKYPFRDMDGTPCVLSLGLDITARKEAETALRKQAELLDLAHDAIIVRDLNARITFWSRGATETYGWTTEQAGGQMSHSLLQTTFPVPMEKVEQEVLEQGTWEGELLHTRADGQVIVVASRWAVQRDDTGAPAAILEINRDITVRQQAEEALRESEARFRQMAENLDDAFLLASADLQLVHYISPAYERLWGLSCDSLYSQPRSWLENVVPADRDKVRAALKKLITRDRPVSHFPAFRINRPDGTLRWIQARFFPIKNEAGEVYRIAGIATDITSRKEVEAILKWREEHLQQTAKMEALGQLAGGVAHDFNNLLTVISGYGELLLADLPEIDPERQQVQAILKAADQATAVTRQLLAFSRKQVLQPQVLDLNDMISVMVDMFSRLVDENIKISMKLTPNLGAVKADPSHMEQVLMNLVINAMDAMPQGGKLTIETGNVEVAPDDTNQLPEIAPGAYVMMTVADTGIGMDQEILSHIFEPFFTTKERGKGTGLGLSMAYGIIKQSGGHILVESVPEQGSVFRIYLPRVTKTKRPAQPPVSASEVSPDKGTILLVEDEEAVRYVVERMLTLKGYSVLTAHDGKGALKIGQSHPGPIHLLLTDVAMPAMGGRELAEQLSAAHPHMKVLFMSGHSEDGMLRRGIRESTINFIQKPFRTEQLIEKVRELLGDSHS